MNKSFYKIREDLLRQISNSNNENVLRLLKHAEAILADAINELGGNS